MGNRPRIEKPFDRVKKARQNVRELYVDLLGPLTNSECDLIINARVDGLGDMFIVALVNQKRCNSALFLDERERLYNERKKPQG